MVWSDDNNNRNNSDSTMGRNDMNYRDDNKKRCVEIARELGYTLEDVSHHDLGSNSARRLFESELSLRNTIIPALRKARPSSQFVNNTQITGSESDGGIDIYEYREDGSVNHIDVKERSNDIIKYFRHSGCFVYPDVFIPYERIIYREGGNEVKSVWGTGETLTDEILYFFPPRLNCKPVSIPHEKLKEIVEHCKENGFKTFSHDIQTSNGKVGKECGYTVSVEFLVEKGWCKIENDFEDYENEPTKVELKVRPLMKSILDDLNKKLELRK
jgi:hypothetical protein